MAALDLPADWDVTRPEADGIEVMAKPRDWPSPFSPTISITNVLYEDGFDFDAYVADQLNGLAQMGAHIIHVDVERSERRLDITAAVDAMGHEVTSMQRHLVGDPGTPVVVAGAMCADADLPEMAPILLHAVRSLERE